MLKTFNLYKDTLHKAALSSDAEIQFEEQRMIRRLQSTKSPCLNDGDLWFTSYSCLQIVADTYERPVIVYCYLSLKDKNPIYESQIYFPLINMDLRDLNNPITLFLAFSHFYYVEFSRTPKGRIKKFNKPTLNTDHNRLRNTYPQICNAADYSVLF